MNLAEHLIEVLEGAERHPEYMQFDIETIYAVRDLFIELRKEAAERQK